MLQYVAENKAWIFSGLGIFLLTCAFAFVRWLIKRRNTAKAPATPINLKVVIESPPPPDSTALVPTPVSPATVIRRLEETPLLLREDVLRHFIGLPLEFTGELTSATKTSTGSIRLLIMKREAVSCEVDSSQYPGLGLLKSGHIIHVRGEISAVMSSIVAVQNAVIRFDLPT
jgi:hypothetical protein